MATEIRIDLSEMLTKVMEPCVKPYKDFLARLHAEGRITAEEIHQVRDEILAAADRSEFGRTGQE